MDIERLRALEKEFDRKRDEANSSAERIHAGGDKDGAAEFDAVADAYHNAGNRIRTLIAELGQEVGAVADERLCDFFADVGEVEQFMDDLCNVVTELTGDEGEDDPITVLRRYIATSPAHTSEARDAALRLLYSKDLYGMLMDVQNGIDSPASAGIANSLIRRIDASRDAAMRQEGGTP